MLFKDHILLKYPRQLITTLRTYPESCRFIIKNKLWIGIDQYGWVSKFLVGVAIFLGLQMYSKIFGWISRVNWEQPFASVNQMGMAMGQVAGEALNLLQSNSTKYIVLILLEVIVYHFSRRTIEVITGESRPAVLKDFIDAQVRMIKVSALSLISETIFVAVIGIYFDIFSRANYIEPVLVFGIHCYYMGFAVLDNYHEQYKLTIKESVKYASHYIGVALGLGVLLKLLMYVPLLGTLIAPLLTAVTAVLVMHRISDLHLLGKKTALYLEEVV